MLKIELIRTLHKRIHMPCLYTSTKHVLHTCFCSVLERATFSRRFICASVYCISLLNYLLACSVVLIVVAFVVVIVIVVVVCIVIVTFVVMYVTACLYARLYALLLCCVAVLYVCLYARLYYAF